MQSNDWGPVHSQALREFLAQGMSYADIARAINSRFGTSYTRNAAIGRSKRMGLAAAERRLEQAGPQTKADVKRLRKARADSRLEVPPSIPMLPREPVKLRCVGITPRLLALVELGPDDCRYPYGGDKEGEPITFCGHPKSPGSSYCGPHFDLTRGSAEQAERLLGPVVLRLVRAA